MKKKLSAVIAAAFIITSLAGCNNNADTNNDGTGNSIVTNSQVDGSSFKTWDSIDRDTVIAHVEGADAECAIQGSM